eukprot:4231957-Prymnesium_polylepis.1
MARSAAALWRALVENFFRRLLCDSGPARRSQACASPARKERCRVVARPPGTPFRLSGAVNERRSAACDVAVGPEHHGDERCRP